MPNTTFEHTPYIEGESSEQDIIRDAEATQRLGAKVLSSVGFEHRTPIVEKSFNKATQRKEKLQGKNGSERRNFAYLRRLENIIAKSGSETEKSLWQKSLEHINIVQTENITESTWRSIQRDNRNHGGGDVELTPQLKEKVAEQYRSVQKSDLRHYIDYFSARECPYPTWFKVYSWDGLTHLSRSSKPDKDGFSVFQRRDKTTTSGFPKLNPAALAKVYDDITKHYDLPTDAKKANKETNETDKLVAKLVQSGNFAKLYSYEYAKLLKPIEVPEKAEDVHGEWIEYDINQVENISTAAEGTPWCIVSPSVARNYLAYGTYGDLEVDEPYKCENSARFILFHLTDPETGLLSKQACASIRLDPDGKVAEISGILDDSNQRLNDSLVTLVKEKTMGYPGGERMFQAFQDNEKLIQLDKKMKNSEPFTEEDLNFIYEKNRKIEQLNPYNRDSRIYAFKNVSSLLKIGTDPNLLVDTLSAYDLEKSYSGLLESGADATHVAQKLGINGLYNHFDEFLRYNPDLNTIVDILSEDPVRLAFCAEKLQKAGVNIDLDKLVDDIGDNDKVGPVLCKDLIKLGADPTHVAQKTNPRYVFRSFHFFENNGAKIDVNELLQRTTEKLYYSEQNNLLVDVSPKELLDLGANPTLLASKLHLATIVEYIDTLQSAGATIDFDKAISSSDQLTIASNIDALVKAGASIDTVIANLDSDEIVKNLDTILQYGANIKEISIFIKKITSSEHNILYSNANEIYQSGIDIHDVLSQLNAIEKIRFLESLKGSGTETKPLANMLVEQMLQPDEIAKYLHYLLYFNADINLEKLVSSLDPKSIVLVYYDKLKAVGAEIDINKILKDLTPDFISHHADLLVREGADIKTIISYLKPIDIILNSKEVSNSIPGININDIAERLSPDDLTDLITNHPNALRSSGVDPKIIYEKMPDYKKALNIDYFLDAGIDIDANAIAKSISDYPTLLASRVDKLVKAGADIDVNGLARKLDYVTLKTNKDALLAAGADIELINTRLNS